MSKRKILLIPTHRQWNGWSLPSKMTVVAGWLAIISLLFGILASTSFWLITKIQDRQASFEDRSVVLYFKSGFMHCEWQLVRLPDLRRLVIDTTPECPQSVVWSPDFSVMMYRISGNLQWRIWERGQTAKRIGNIPFDSDDYAPAPSFFFGEFSNRPRTAFMVEALIKEEDEKSRTYVALGREYHVNLNDCELGEIVEKTDEGYRRGLIPYMEHVMRVPMCEQDYHYSTLNGATTKPHAGSQKIQLPGHGVIYIAVAMEFDESGNWTIVDAAPTKSEASGTPGYDVFPDLMRSIENSLSTYKIMNACGPDECLSKFDDELLSWLKTNYSDHKVMGMDGGFGRIDLVGDSFIVFPVVQGSMLHQFTPVYLCKGSCAEAQRLGYKGHIEPTRIPDHVEGFGDEKYLKPLPDQIDIYGDDEYLMVSEEYLPEYSEVFLKKNGKRIASFEGGTSYLLPRGLSNAYFSN